MKKLYVYADFDWLKEIELIGELGYESLRGSDSYSFSFNDGWLKKHGDLFLSDDLNNYPGVQYTQPGKDIFGCFSDALPDRWGRYPIFTSGADNCIGREQASTPIVIIRFLDWYR